MYFHYTNGCGAEAIGQTGCILPSEASGSFGPGVYLTDLNPKDFFRDEILENNYGGIRSNFSNRADWVVEVLEDNINMQLLRRVHCHTGDRRIFVYPTSITVSADQIYDKPRCFKNYAEDNTSESDADGFDADGFDANGFDADGFDADGFHYFDFDADGVDADGFDADGFDADGFDAEGFDYFGFDADGVDADGFDSDGVLREPDDCDANAENDETDEHQTDDGNGSYVSETEETGYSESDLNEYEGASGEEDIQYISDEAEEYTIDNSEDEYCGSDVCECDSINSYGDGNSCYYESDGDSY